MSMEPEIEPAEQYVHYFKFEGRRYKLFKRTKSKDAVWYVHFKRKRTRYLRSLDSNIAEKAARLAKAIIAAVKNESWGPLTETKQHRDIVYATLGEIFDCYKAHRGEIKERTCKNNILALTGILKMVFELPDEEAVCKLSTEQLDRQVIRKYKQLVAPNDDDDENVDEDEEDILRAKRTANSYLGQGRSVFARHMLEVYEDQGWKLPDMRPFTEALGFRGAGKTEYNAPDGSLIAKTFKSLDQELRTSDPSAYTAVCLAAGAGLRRSEVSKAKWSWFKIENGTAFLNADILGKDGLVIKNVPVEPEMWKRLQAVRLHQLKRGKKADGYILDGDKTERTEEIFRRIGTWMRRLGWQTQKTLHEFRAYIGSKVARDHGIEAASMFLRHKDTRTTRQFYLRYVEMKKITWTEFSKAAA